MPLVLAWHCREIAHLVQQCGAHAEHHNIEGGPLLCIPEWSEISVSDSTL